MSTERAEEIKNNIEIIKGKIDDAAQKCGRSIEEIRLMAVSKTKPVEDIKAAYEAGQRLFGENRIQEAAEKFNEIPSDAEMHMIGHLQRNKVKTAAKSASCVQSIDKYETAAELDKRVSEYGRKIDILIEINTSGEASKSGYADYNVFLNDLDKYMKLQNLNLRGLMTIAPFTNSENEIRKSFASLYKSYERLKNDAGTGIIDTLSMGMSSDFVLAVMEGSNLVRVGTAIFGSRIY